MSDTASYWIEFAAEYSDEDILGLHDLIAGSEYRFENRRFREQGDVLEAELRRRGLVFDPIQWTLPMTGHVKAG